MPRRRHPLLTAFQYMGKKGLWGCGGWGCSRARGEAPTFSQEAAGGGGRGWGTTNGVGWEALLILLLISSRPIPPESTWVVVPWGRGRGAKGRRRRWRNGRRRKRKRRGTLGVAARSLLGGGGSLTYLNVSSSRETKNGIHGIDAAAAPPSLVATAWFENRGEKELRKGGGRRGEVTHACARMFGQRRDDIYVSIDWVPPSSATAPGTFVSREIEPCERRGGWVGGFLWDALLHGVLANRWM